MTPEETLVAEIAADAARAATDTPPPEDALEYAQQLADEVNSIDARLEKYDEVAAELRNRKNAILGRELVELMDTKGIEVLGAGGRTFKAAPYCKAAIPKEHQDEAHDWLEEHDAGDLIKYEISVMFPKDCQEEAERLEAYVRQNFQIATVEKKRGVPWARLTSWLKDLIESDVQDKVLPPLDIMGATIGRVVKITGKRSS